MPVLTAIPFVQVDSTQNPSTRVHGDRQLRAYWEAIVGSMASFRRWNPDLDLAVISNAPWPQHVDGDLTRPGVRHLHAEFAHRPPPGLYHRFNAAFFLLDALDVIEPGTTAVLIDPDVVCIRPIDGLVERVTTGFGALKLLDTAPDEDVNGLSLKGSAEVHAALGLVPEVPDHFGGEVYVFPPAVLPAARVAVENAWRLSLERTERGESRFTTEEHVFNYVARVTGVTDLAPDVGRVWTAHRYRTVGGREDRLTLWHLPAEKDRGFVTLIDLVRDPGSWFWTAERDEFVRRLGRVFGLHGRPPKRWAIDTAGRIRRRVIGPF